MVDSTLLLLQHQHRECFKKKTGKPNLSAPLEPIPRGMGQMAPFATTHYGVALVEMVGYVGPGTAEDSAKGVGVFFRQRCLKK
jgi:hypothetical protein